jgi:hypothetical protein
MLNPNQNRRGRLSAAVAATAELTGTQFSAAAMDMICEELAKYPEDEALVALARCRREVTGRLTLAAILDRLPADPRTTWPTPNQAWAMVGTADEARTLVAPQEAMQAWGEVRELLQSDDVAARMAFLDAYRRKVELAKAENRAPQWTVSLGQDPGERYATLTRAVEQGLLDRSHAESMLERPIESKALPPARPNGPGELRLLEGGRGQAPKTKPSATGPRDIEHAESLRDLASQLAKAKSLDAPADPAEMSRLLRQAFESENKPAPVVVAAKGAAEAQEEAMAAFRQREEGRHQ